MIQDDGAAEHSFETIQEGREEHRDYCISPEILAGFLATFGDRSPLHVDAEYARAAGFPGPVTHGTLLNGFLSHFVGMVFPGRRAMLLSVDLRYLSPGFLGDEIRLDARVAQKQETSRALVLHVRFTRLRDEMLLAAGKALVMVHDA